jgi:hypothetical protein
MSSKTSSATAAIPAAEISSRRRRSWVDVVLAWLGRFPGPFWLIYAILTALFVIAGTLVRWADGSVPLGLVDSGRVLNDVFTLYGLAVVRYLTVTAGRALDEFRPALGELEPQYGELKRKLTTVSWAASLVPVGIGAAFTAVSMLSDPAGWGLSSRSPFGVISYVAVQGIAFVSFFFMFLVVAVRQLIVVVQVHRRATNVSLYSSGSNSAFSRLTLRTSIGLVLPVYVYAFVAIIAKWTFAKTSWVEVAALATVLISSVALFALPLNGMRRRLVRQKSGLIADANRRFEVAANRLHEAVDADNFLRVDELNKVMGSLVTEKDTVRRLSTWPWEADTLRGFVSSIVLPILLWLVTTLLSRLIP